MKIIISPSKTKKINNLPIKDSGSLTEKEPFYLEITNEIIEKIKTFSVEEIEKKFKLKNEKAQKLLEFYKNYENEKSGNALASYTGVAYKAIKIETFDKSDFEYLESHLVILSALYGVLTPYTNVKEYRLDMTNSIFESKSLYKVWKSSVNEYFEQEDVILNMELPSFKYSFSDGRGEKEVTKDNLLSVLSTGERRAYYILNMVFQILVAKKQGKECLVVLDDISESFDYKNKYAIIEYISDISEYTDENDEKLFKILLLTHNFDFYRTVSSRITKPGNSFIAFVDSDKIKLERGQYTKNIFMHYKNTLVKKYSDNIMVASIPFVRNLIEYTEGDDNKDLSINGKCPYFRILIKNKQI